MRVTRQQAMMSQSWEFIAGQADSPILLIADHASNHVPEGIELGIDPLLQETHIAIDIGVSALGRALCRKLGCPAVMGAVSRLVIDLNREKDAPNIIPAQSDGTMIPGNMLGAVERAQRIERFWEPYHGAITAQIDAQRPLLLISLHSFTPQLSAEPDQQRPWEIGILYNQDDRAARIAIPGLAERGVIVGDQLPYSGKLLNATMNMHGEARGIAYLGIEMRQDLISDAAGVARWADTLVRVIEESITAIAS